jgi:hypothetical protein
MLVNRLLQVVLCYPKTLVAFQYPYSSVSVHEAVQGETCKTWLEQRSAT